MFCDPSSTEEDQLGMELCEVLHFGGSNLRNGASYALDQYRTLIGNCIRRIDRYHLRAPTATGIARNRLQNRSNLSLSIASNGSHVALSERLLSFL